MHLNDLFLLVSDLLLAVTTQYVLLGLIRGSGGSKKQVIYGYRLESMEFR